MGIILRNKYADCLKNHLALLSVLYFSMTVSVFGQTPNSIVIDYSTLRYVVSDIDTNSITCTVGNFGDSNYHSYDSAYISANILFPTLPIQYSRDSLFEKTKMVMIAENVQNVRIWRDAKSFWMIPFSYRSTEMSQQYNISFVGYMSLNDDNIHELFSQKK